MGFRVQLAEKALLLFAVGLGRSKKNPDWLQQQGVNLQSQPSFFSTGLDCTASEESLPPKIKLAILVYKDTLTPVTTYTPTPTLQTPKFQHPPPHVAKRSHIDASNHEATYSTECSRCLDGTLLFGGIAYCITIGHTFTNFLQNPNPKPQAPRTFSILPEG